MKRAAIILASGSGQRLQTVVHDKMLLRIGRAPLINWSLGAFIESGLFQQIILTYRDDEQKKLLEDSIILKLPDDISISWVQGGTLRQDSVWNALQVVEPDCDCVYIHDGARPFISPEDIYALDAHLQNGTAAAMARKVTDTIKLVTPAASDSLELEELDRSRLYAMQTPQAFPYHRILQAYQSAISQGEILTDCVGAYSFKDYNTHLVEPSQDNFKITRPEDVTYANYLLETGQLKKWFELPDE